MNTKTKYTHLVPDVWDSLKKLPRTGWVRRNVSAPETVAEHTLSLITLTEKIIPHVVQLSDQEKELLLEMLEIHDWAESDPNLGDISARDVGQGAEFIITSEEKHNQEKVIMERICKSLGNTGEVILSLWEEFESADTRIAQIAKQLDKMQAVLKAIEYETSNNGQSKIAWEFYSYAKDKIIFIELQDYLRNQILDSSVYHEL